MSRRIVFCILAATSALVMTPAAQAAQGARIIHIHATPQPSGPSPQPGLRHSSEQRFSGIGHHGRRNASFAGWGWGGGYGAATFVDAPYAFGAGPYPYPYPRPDPDWRICQIGAATDLYYECGPFSYHPFGIYGYRPNGVYGGSASAARDYVQIPSAKIITIDDGK